MATNEPAKEETQMSEIPDSQRLRAQGAEITLKDGRTVRLVFGWHSLAELEQKYGSLDAWGEAFDGGFKARGWTATFDGVLAAGLHLGMDGDLPALLDFHRKTAYRLAVAAAYAEAWPAPETSVETEQGKVDGASGSPGAPGTTLPSPAITSAPRSSGE